MTPKDAEIISAIVSQFQLISECNGWSEAMRHDFAGFVRGRAFSSDDSKILFRAYDMSSAMSCAAWRIRNVEYAASLRREAA